MAQPNKDYWTGSQVSGYERKQRLLVPRKGELLDTIVDLIPFDEKQGFRVVDVGAGQGALSERVVRRFERAHVVLLDTSAEMLAVAKERLAKHAPRFSILVGDFNDAEWYAPIAQPVSAVVSSIALHYLRTERRALFFDGVYRLLQTPGCLANGGAFDTEHPFIQGYSDRKHIEFTQRGLLEQEERRISLQRLRNNWKTETAKAGINRLRLTEQTALLEAAGFSHVEVVWRCVPMAVVVAYKGSLE